MLLAKGVKVLETAVGAVFAPTRFFLVRISIRDLVADGKSLLRNSGVGGGGGNLILTSFPLNFRGVVCQSEFLTICARHHDKPEQASSDPASCAYRHRPEGIFRTFSRPDSGPHHPLQRKKGKFLRTGLLFPHYMAF